MPKREKAEAAEAAEVGALHEQRWVYERRVERMGYEQIRELAARPAREGGLGRDLTHSQLKTRFRDYVGRMREVEAETIDEHRGRELPTSTRKSARSRRERPASTSRRRCCAPALRPAAR